MKVIDLTLKQSQIFEILNWSEINISQQFKIPLNFYSEIDLVEFKDLDIFNSKFKKISNVEDSEYYQTFLRTPLFWFWAISEKNRYIFCQNQTQTNALIKCYQISSTEEDFYATLSSADLIFSVSNKVVKATTETAGLSWQVGNQILKKDEFEILLNAAINIKMARPFQIAQQL